MMRQFGRGAFSLLEVLVVIALIAILISVLIPTFSRIRRQADLTVCASNLRQIGAAIHARAAERGGYAPLAGTIIVPASVQGGAMLSAALGDAGRTRYDYVPHDGGTTGEVIASLHVALARHLGVGTAIHSAYIPPPELISRWEVFTCPAAAPRYPMSSTFTIQIEGSYALNVMQQVPMDFALNDAVFGYGPGRLSGKLSKIGKPSATLLLADAAPLPVFEHIGSSVPLFWSPATMASRPLTLYDAFAENGRVTSAQKLFDPQRHRKRANVLYADGHVGATSLDPSGLSSVIVADW